MHSKKRHGILAAAAGLAVSLVLGAVALAAGDGGWIDPAGTNAGPNTLTVQACGDNVEAAFAEDLATSDVVVDIYKIGTATKNPSYDTYDYALTEDFSDLTLTNDMNSEQWQALADAAAEKVTLTSSGTLAAGSSISGLDDGLYLILAHGSGRVESGYTSRSNTYEYTFDPSLVVLPNKSAIDGVIGTAVEYGDWKNEVEVALKPERAPLYGSLRITKDVSENTGEDATFVFHIVDVETGGELYDNYASVTLENGATEGDVTVGHIRAGLQVKVTEEYGGARYDLGTVTVGEKGDVIIAEDTIDFSCHNEPTGDRTYGGHGVQNNFKFDTEAAEGTGDWTWTDTPSKRPAADQAE